MTLREYCNSKEITMLEFAKATEVSFSYLYRIQNKEDINVTANTIVKIYQGTKRVFGEGLKPSEYLKNFKEIT